jgi:hypothetical protein
MKKYYLKHLLFICLLSTNVAYSSSTVIQAIKNASLHVASLLWSGKGKLLATSLIAGMSYVTILSLINAKKHRAKKEAIQNSIPMLVQRIEHLKKRAIKKQMLLGSDWYVYIAYDNVYDHVLNHDSTEYKLIKKYYAQEKMYRKRAALSIIALVLMGGHLHKICSLDR